MKYILTICRRRVELEVPEKIDLSNDKYIRLASDNEEPCEFRALYTVCDELPDVAGAELLAGEYLFLPLQTGMRIARVSIKTGRPYVCTEWDYNTKSAVIRLSRDYAACLAYAGHIRNYLRMDILLYLMDAFTLHAALIEHSGYTIAFTAPSGTGKSTQAALWEKHFGSTIINGDNAAITKQNGMWLGCGFPYSGSSGISINNTAPLKAIVCLKQGQKNEIRRMLPRQIMSFVYPQLLIQRLDPRIVQKSIDLLAEISAEVPVYELNCLPDRGAVDLLYKTISDIRECVP